MPNFVIGGGTDVKASNMSSNPFTGPKLHLYKKNASRRIKTSSATRNLNEEGIFPSNYL